MLGFYEFTHRQQHVPPGTTELSVPSLHHANGEQGESHQWSRLYIIHRNLKGGTGGAVVNGLHHIFPGKRKHDDTEGQNNGVTEHFYPWNQGFAQAVLELVYLDGNPFLHAVAHTQESGPDEEITGQLVAPAQGTVEKIPGCHLRNDHGGNPDEQKRQQEFL